MTLSLHRIWRSPSDRRYRFTVAPVAAAELPGACVALAVRRDKGTVLPVDEPKRFETSVSPAQRLAWIGRIAKAGATELRIHVDAQSPGEREAIVKDLT